jgi:uncharacterized protein YecE (DUF72 family)
MKIRAERFSREKRPVLTKEERRAKRVEKRERQRASNIGRAAKMHVARLDAKSMRPRPAQQTGRPSAQKYFIGCSGWFYWHWRGIFYPEGLPTADWFKHYVKNFNTVELNAPFYSWPTLNTVASWNKQAGSRRFVYTVKVCELITHLKKFVGTKTLVQDFGFIADQLDERMGCFLFQLPPSFHYTPARLRNIMGQLDPLRRNVVEFRHGSWWDKKVFAAFRESGITFCSCSGPRLPDTLVKTSDLIYIRFHGVSQWYRHDYSREELAAWAQKIKESEAKRVYAYFNNDRGGHAIKNAHMLRRMLES